MTKYKQRLARDEYELEIAESAPAHDYNTAESIRLDLPDETREEILGCIGDVIDGAATDEERKKFIERLEDTRLRYEMKDKDTDFPWEGCSKRRTGGMTMVLDRLKPRLKRSLFYSGRIFDIRPKKDSNQEIADRQARFLDITARNEMDLENAFDKVLHDALTVNLGILKAPWVATEDQIEETNKYENVGELLNAYPDAVVEYPEIVLKLSGMATMEDFIAYIQQYKAAPPNPGEPVYIREKFVDYKSGMKPEWVDPKDIIFPCGVRDDSIPWIIVQKLKMRRDELLKKRDCGFFDFKDEDVFGEEDEKSEDEGEDYKGKAEYEYCVYESMVMFDIDSDGLEERIIVWGVESKRGGEQPEKLVWLRGIRYPYEHSEPYWIVYRSESPRYGFYSGGLYKKLHSVCESEDRRQNQISNAWDQAIVKGWKQVKIPGSPYNPRVHKYFPGCNIPVADPNELTEFGMSDIPASSMTLLDDNRREIEMLSGVVSSAMSGQDSPTDPTAPAKKTEMLIAESNLSISEYLKNIVKGFRVLGRQMQRNYYQFMDGDELEFEGPHGFESISKAELRAPAEFDCRSTIESVSMAQRAQSSLSLLVNLSNNPLVAQNLGLQARLIKNVIDNWSEDTAGISDEFMTPEMMSMIQQQIQAANLLAEQQAAQEAKLKEMMDQGMSRDEAMAMMQQEAQQAQGQPPEGMMQ